MTDPEYEQLKKHLEEQRRIGMELVERAYEAQMRSLEMIRTLQGGSGPVALPAQVSPEAPERPRRRTATEVTSDVLGIIASLPERFSRQEVCEALGYEPDRGALYKTLQKLVQGGWFVVEATGQGQTATVYRKTPD
ncbi:MAG TPA: hypothetical protein VGM86_20760 [Thermoanaerobaculia bacterium]|jgi:hypothetical protein